MSLVRRIFRRQRHCRTDSMDPDLHQNDYAVRVSTVYRQDDEVDDLYDNIENCSGDPSEEVIYIDPDNLESDEEDIKVKVYGSMLSIPVLDTTPSKLPYGSCARPIPSGPANAPPLPPKKNKKKEKQYRDPLKKVPTVFEIAYSDLKFGNQLGMGGSGVVFKGWWKTPCHGGVCVAIKRVVGKIREEEVEILSKLRHPNVIEFYGVSKERHEYFIITEFAAGGSLYDCLYEKKYHPNEKECLQWVKQIAEGMCYLHEQKIIHRDLKSRNVLLGHSGMKLCDFGSAKKFDHTTEQNTTGTYRWIAPEVLKGEKVSLSCDVFSYGMVILEIFKQEIPFAGVHDLQVVQMIVKGMTPAIPTSFKPYLVNLMKRCWLMNSKARPSFLEILSILKKRECSEPASEDSKAPKPKIKATARPIATLLTIKDLPQLQKSLEEASIMWYPLGTKLNLDSKTLTGIATASGKVYSTALGLVLTRWLTEATDSLPTLEILIAALSSPEIGMSHLADSLSKDYEQLTSHAPALTESILVTDEDDPHIYEERPEWTKAITVPPKLDTLAALEQEALFIPRDQLTNFKQIGEGQFGKVFKAKLSRGEQCTPVAVKTTKKSTSKADKASFLKEMSVMSQMMHPNIVRLYGLVQEDISAPWIVLEYLPHGDLKRFLMKNSRPVQQLVKYMIDVAMGMHYISERGLIHRDLAARNILVGDGEHCKVSDFGLLQELPKDDAIYHSNTKVPCPIRWMPPESLCNRQFSIASDVWSFGILMWEMFSPSKLPYEQLTNYECVAKVTEGYRMPTPRGCPPLLARIMKACWNEKSDKRPSFLLISTLLSTKVTFDY